MSEPRKRENRESLVLPVLLPVGVLALIATVLFLFSRVLLAISHNAATVVACITAAGVITVATIVSSRKRLTGAALLPMVGTIFGIALIAGGVAIVAVGPQKEGGEAKPPITVDLAAPVGAATKGFTPTKLTFEEDTPTTLNFNNQDPTVSHNVVIFQGKDATTPVAFTGALVTGPAAQAYNVPGLAAGSYFFHCEVHPTAMTGTITVTPAPAGGGTGGSPGPAGLSITAASTAFNASELDVVADTPTPLTFINNDPATTHNVSVYKDAGFATNVFKGDAVVGPATQTYQLPSLAAGTYYFKCDFHPTMKGTLVVAAGASATASP